MEARNYLPSGQFTSMLAALLISSGLITAAVHASPVFSPAPAYLSADQTDTPDLTNTNPDWQQAFAGDTVPVQMADIQNQADQLAAGIKSSNLTDTLGKSLLAQYGALQGQGIADNTDAQAQAATAALAEIQKTPQPPAYTRNNLQITDSTTDTLHAWGNAFPAVVFLHRSADEDVAMLLFGAAVDTNNSSSLTKLSAVADEYRALARDTVKLSVPSLLAVYELQLANNYVSMASAISDMQQVIADPARGLLGLQTFLDLATNNAQTLVQINSLFKQGGIVFAKGESGTAWDSFAAQAATNSAQPQTTPQSGTSQ